MRQDTTSPADDELRRRVGELTLEAKVALLTGADAWSTAPEPAVGLARMVLSDGPVGVRGEHWNDRYPSANLPTPTALAATWDLGLVRRLGGLLAAEARRKGVNVLLAPTVNLHRTPRGGRHFECFSEDPLLTGEIGRAYVDGLQDGGVAACVKHFVGNDQETQRLTVDISVDERTLREVYLAPFERITGAGEGAGAGSWSVMTAYNRINGTTMTEHPMVNDLLKGEWGYDGLVMSDWFACRSVGAAGRGGLDLAMPGPSSPWVDGLVEAVRSGEVPEPAVDDKVVRLLRLAARTGALDAAVAPTPERAASGPGVVPADADSLCREAAVASYVLVQNSGVLPLPPTEPSDSAAPETRATLAVVGPNAIRGRNLGGGSATVFPERVVHPAAGLAAALPDTEVRTALGVRSSERAAVLDDSSTTLPDGSGPGVLVEFLGDDDAVLAAHRHRIATFHWLNSVNELDDPRALRAIRVRCRYRADAPGVHRIGASAVGHVSVTVGGRTRTDEVTLPPGSDMVEALMTPPQLLIDTELTAGEQVDVSVVVVSRPDPVTGGISWALQFNALPPYDGDDAAIAHAAGLAAASDAAVVVVGTTEEVESEGYDRADLGLPGRQDDLVRAVLAANPRTVVVVNAGAPVAMPWLEEAPAVLLCWFPGQQFGAALADVLTGRAEPGGRMPTTWGRPAEAIAPRNVPVDGTLRYDEGVHVGYRAYLRQGVSPAVPFGHGLGYTTWALSEVRCTGPDAVAVTVRNTGKRPGKQVIQVYLTRPESAVERPVRWLAAFEPLWLGAGESRTLTLAIPRSAYRHWDVSSGAWATEPGTFQVLVGTSVVDLAEPVDVEIGATTMPDRHHP